MKIAKQSSIWQPFDRPLLVIDVETTGTDPQIHQVVSLGALLLNPSSLKEEQAFYSLAHASRKSLKLANAKAMSIHGLTYKELSKAPKPKEIVDTFLRKFGNNFYFCGWNICFDTQFIAALFKSAGRQDDFAQFRYHKFDVWSLLEIAWMQGCLQEPPNSLSSVSRFFKIKRSQLHDALEDTRITAEVLRKTLRLLKGKHS